MTNLRIDPNPPLRGVDLFFFPIFLNTTDTVQNFRWLVYIYRSNNLTTSFSETTVGQFVIPTSNSEFKSLGAWKIALGGPCENFIARVGWFDQENKLKMFVKFENEVYEKPLSICPP